ncbi:MYND-type zinc finger-containing chromatin reader ZMYND8-like isoform X2 [Lineus longissimus]|uniref:MYND-type zinc finger-containing chromatin reader ZMYND8-like isoform X2 n=1 Tax=Lineus longissimus TaxID=88925 RepID=UPI002B4C7C1C
MSHTPNQKEVVTTRSRKSNPGESPRDTTSTLRSRSERHERARTESPKPGTPLAKIATPKPKFSSPKKDLDAGRARRSRGWNVPKESAAAIFRATSVDKNPAPARPKKRQSVEDSDSETSDDPPLKRRRASKTGGTNSQPAEGSSKRPQGMESDCYCWICHKEGNAMVSCELCPRVYHVKGCLPSEKKPGLDWMCPECETIMRAECTDTRSRAMTMLSLDHLCSLLRFALQRMKHMGSEPFQSPVDPDTVPNYDDYVVYPMDLDTLEKNIDKKLYGCTDAFLADAKWLLHNCVIYNGTHHKLTTAAKMIVKICKHEMNEIEICPDCYSNSQCKGNPDWFCLPCRYPHPLVWAKLKGYPFWPAKVLRKTDNQVDVRFFGAHDRSWLPVSQIFLLSKEIPVPVKNKRGGLENSIAETDRHIKLLREKFGHFEYAPFRTPYDREDIYCPIKLSPEVDVENTAKIRKKRARRTTEEEKYGTGFEDSGSGPMVDALYRKPRRLQKFQSETARMISASSKTASALKSKYNSFINTRRGGPRGGAALGARSRSNHKTPSGVFVVSKDAAVVREAALATEPTEEAAEPADPQTHFFKTLNLKKGPEKSAENPVNGVHIGGHGGTARRSSFTKSKVLDTCDKMAVLKIPRLDMMAVEKGHGQGQGQSEVKRETSTEEANGVITAPPVKRTRTPPTTLTPPPETDLKPPVQSVNDGKIILKISTKRATQTSSAAAVSAKDSVSTVTKDLVSTVTKDPVSTVAKDPVSIAKDSVSTVAKEFVSTVAKDSVSTVAKDSVSTVAKDSVSTVAKDSVSTVAKDPVSAVAKDTVSMVTKDPVPAASKDPALQRDTPKANLESVTKSDNSGTSVAEDLQIDDSAKNQVEEDMDLGEKTPCTQKSSDSKPVGKDTIKPESITPDRPKTTVTNPLPDDKATSNDPLVITTGKKSALHEQLQKTIACCRKNLGIEEEVLKVVESGSKGDGEKVAPPQETSAVGRKKTTLTEGEMPKAASVSKPGSNLPDKSDQKSNTKGKGFKPGTEKTRVGSVGDNGKQVSEKELKKERIEANKMEVEKDSEKLTMKISESKSCESLKNLLSREIVGGPRSLSVPADAKEHGMAFKELADRMMGEEGSRASSEPPGDPKEKQNELGRKGVDAGVTDPAIKNILAKVKQLSDRNVVKCKTVVPPIEKGSSNTDASKARNLKMPIVVEKVILRTADPTTREVIKTAQSDLRSDAVEQSRELSEEEMDSSDAEKLVMDLGEEKRRGGKVQNEGGKKVVAARVTERNSSVSSRSSETMDIAPIEITIPIPPPVQRGLPQPQMQPRRGPFNFGKYRERMLQTIQGTFQELYKDVVEHEQSMAGTLKYQQELDQLKWAHRNHLGELKHNFELAMKEVTSNLNQERNKAIAETKKACEEAAKKELEEAKKKQWCAQCGKEAIFYCCWNTSYCDFPCQQSHWPEHMSSCTQSQTGANAPPNAAESQPTPALTPSEGQSVVDGQSPKPVVVPVPPTPVATPPNIPKVSQPGHMQLPPSSQVMYFPVSGPQTMQAGQRPPHMQTTMTTTLPHIQMPNMNVRPPMQQPLPGQMILQQQRPLQPGQMLHSVIQGQPPNFGNRMMTPMQQPPHAQPQPQLHPPQQQMHAQQQQLHAQPQPQMPVYVLGNPGFGLRQQSMLPQFQQRPF